VGPTTQESLAAALARARQSWPGLALDLPALAARLESLGAALAKADVEGLALAGACLAGDPAAQSALESQLTGAVESALRRLGASDDEIDEVQQRLRLDLLLPGRRRPKLEYYSGRGSLRGWLRAVAAQEFIDLRRGQKRSPPAKDLSSFFFEAASAPDAQWIREECRAAFRLALEEAIDSLPDRERAALRMSALDGLAIDDIARVFQMHRSTAARWLVRARAEVAERVRDGLVRRLGASAGELSSIVRIVGDEVPVTFERLLGPRS
jgi:RNA polymerase sigma-70 factor (ECF subfamily)